MPTRWRRFSALRIEPLQDQVSQVHAERPGYEPAKLSPSQLLLAQLFDGSRDAAAIRAAAHQQLGVTWTAAQLEAYASQLAQAGLLQPGTHEPLPVPAQTLREANELGWTGASPGAAGAPIKTAALPPSSVPGARGSPGLAYALDRAGTQFDREFSPAALIAAGRCFGWALNTRTSLLVALLISLVSVCATISHRHEFFATLTAAWNGGWVVLQTLMALLLLHGAAVAARARAIAVHSPERPRSGWRRGFLGIPYIAVDSGGAFERASRTVRLRLIGAPLMATLLLGACAAYVWLMLGRTHIRLAQLAAVIAALAAISTLLRLNPLARREGYRMLSHGLGVPDLREQAMVSIFGFERPWYQQPRKLSRRMLLTYAMLCIVFLIAMLVLAFAQLGSFLADRYGGIGFIIFAGLMGAYMFRQFTKDRIAAARATLGWKRDWKPSRRDKIIASVALILCCFPYRYEPSGDLVVLPNQRADVRALVAGDVREVLVQEGDEVKAGQVIARLRDDEARSRVAQAEAALAQLQADLALYKRGAKAEEVEVARQRVNVARKRAQVSRDNAARLKQAFDKQSITAFEYDRARGNAEVDEQSLLEAERALELTASPAMADQINAREAQVKGAAATLQFNREQLADTEIKAPIAGRIVSGSLRFAVGTFLERGALLATVENSKELIAEIRLPESAIAEIKPGNGASAKVWAYPGSTFEGRISSVAPAAEQGTYGKVVRVQMTLQDPEGRLKPEMTGSAKAEGDRHMAIVVFTRAIARFVMIEVWSWLP